jgi:hypothetical protein
MQLGAAGQRCVSERAAGGTVPGTGGNWFAWYRDPIANDPNAIPDPEPGSVLTRNADGTVTVTTPAGVVEQAAAAAGIPMPLLLGLAAVGVALFVGGKR